MNDNVLNLKTYRDDKERARLETLARLQENQVGATPQPKNDASEKNAARPQTDVANLRNGGRVKQIGDGQINSMENSSGLENAENESGFANNRVFRVAKKINPEIGIATKGLSSIISPLAAAKKKFGAGTVYLMLATALFFDVFIAVVVGFFDFVAFGLGTLLLGSLFDYVALMTFALWFKIKGAKFGKTRSFSLMGGFIVELIPFVNLLPAWTLAVFLSFLQENIKEAKPTNAEKSLNGSLLKRAA